MRGRGGAGLWAVSVPALGGEDDLFSPMEEQWRYCCCPLVHTVVPPCNACNTFSLLPLSASVQHTCIFWDGVLASCATEGCVMGESLKSRDEGKPGQLAWHLSPGAHVSCQPPSLHWLWTEGVSLQQHSHSCVKAAWKEEVLLLLWLPAWFPVQKSSSHCTSMSTWDYSSKEWLTWFFSTSVFPMGLANSVVAAVLCYFIILERVALTCWLYHIQHWLMPGSG